MATISSYFEQAELSLAAYALNLQRDMFGQQDNTYVRLLKDAGMSDVQAKQFADTYAVVHQYTEPFLGTGLSATVFQKTTESGTEYFLAVRGTEGFLSRDFIEDPCACLPVTAMYILRSDICDIVTARRHHDSGRKV